MMTEKQTEKQKAAGKVYDEAVAVAGKAYDEAMAAAWKAYRKARAEPTTKGTK